MKRILLIGLVIISLTFVLLFFLENKQQNTVVENNPVNQIKKSEKEKKKTYPIAEFEQRITKKKFGDYITSATSLVQPERFSGWHTGVDVEYDGNNEEIPVLAVCDGEIVLAKWVSGYGGTIVLKCQIENNDYYIIYGHLDTDSFIGKTEITKGEKLAVLGNGFSQETDFERKHLHFGIHKNSLDLRGYVQNESELGEWVDPLTTELFN